jgi:hypothetical protein
VLISLETEEQAKDSIHGFYPLAKKKVGELSNFVLLVLFSGALSFFLFCAGINHD